VRETDEAGEPAPCPLVSRGVLQVVWGPRQCGTNLQFLVGLWVRKLYAVPGKGVWPLGECQLRACARRKLRRHARQARP